MEDRFSKYSSVLSSTFNKTVIIPKAFLSKYIRKAELFQILIRMSHMSLEIGCIELKEGKRIIGGSGVQFPIDLVPNQEENKNSIF